jgi:hypothetical protein
MVGAAVIGGSCPYWLPCIGISFTGGGEWLLRKGDAIIPGGICHLGIGVAIRVGGGTGTTTEKRLYTVLISRSSSSILA